MVRGVARLGHLRRPTTTRCKRVRTGGEDSAQQPWRILECRSFGHVPRHSDRHGRSDTVHPAQILQNREVRCRSRHEVSLDGGIDSNFCGLPRALPQATQGASLSTAVRACLRCPDRDGAGQNLGCGTKGYHACTSPSFRRLCLVCKIDMSAACLNIDWCGTLSVGRCIVGGCGQGDGHRHDSRAPMRIIDHRTW